MIKLGVDALRISKDLGHASVAFTLNKYGHLFPEDLHVGADLLDKHLEGII